MGASWGSKQWLFTGMFLENLNSVYKTLQAEPTNRKKQNEQGWKTECHARGVLLKYPLVKVPRPEKALSSSSCGYSLCQFVFLHCAVEQCYTGHFLKIKMVN